MRTRQKDNAENSAQDEHSAGEAEQDSLVAQGQERDSDNNEANNGERNRANRGVPAPGPVIRLHPSAQATVNKKNPESDPHGGVRGKSNGARNGEEN